MGKQIPIENEDLAIWLALSTLGLGARQIAALRTLAYHRTLTLQQYVCQILTATLYEAPEAYQSRHRDN